MSIGGVQRLYQSKVLDRALVHDEAAETTAFRIVPRRDRTLTVSVLLVVPYTKGGDSNTAGLRKGIAARYDRVSQGTYGLKVSQICTDSIRKQDVYPVANCKEQIQSLKVAMRREMTGLSP